MLNKIKSRMGIHESITVYDTEIQDYIADAIQDMKESGVPGTLADSENEQVLTALTYYVKANTGNDRSDTNRYMSLYQKKVFRLSLKGGEENVEPQY